MATSNDETTIWLKTILNEFLFSAHSAQSGGATDVLIGRAVHTPRGTFCVIRHLERIRYKESIVNRNTNGRYTRYAWRRVGAPEYRVCLYRDRYLVTLFVTPRRELAENKLRCYVQRIIPLPAPIAESLV